MKINTHPASRQVPPSVAEPAETSRRPSHHVYAVRRGDAGKGFWTVISAAWVNRDGEGFNLKLDYLPLNGAELVVRKPKPDAAETA